jgi:hypothetical protein
VNRDAVSRRQGSRRSTRVILSGGSLVGSDRHVPRVPVRMIHRGRLAADGYHLFEVETVPFGETQPSPDGAFWRCKRPDGSRRCFFAPPPNT